jgi:hypothetical protein
MPVGIDDTCQLFVRCGMMEDSDVRRLHQRYLFNLPSSVPNEMNQWPIVCVHVHVVY